MNRKYNIVELFSGIGSQAKALNNIGMEIDVIGTCEWDIHAFVAYDAIHNSTDIPAEVKCMKKEELLELIKGYILSNNGKEAVGYNILKKYSLAVLQRVYTAIQRSNNFVDVNSLKGNNLTGDIDILTYSFPCQDLSNVGAFHGYNRGIDQDSGSRSSLLWQVGRILSEMKEDDKSLPRFLVMENVPTLLSKRHFPDFTVWLAKLEELGYVNKYYQLNATSFGLPQNRPRLLMVSVFTGDNVNLTEKVEKFFSIKDEAAVIEDYRKSKYFQDLQIKDLLRINYSNPKIFNEALECTPNDTVSRQKIWDGNPQIVLTNNEINDKLTFVRTITTKQDRNPNSGNLYFDSKMRGKSKFRYLTPRECFLFMGFTDEDYKCIVKNNPEIRKGTLLFSRDKIIRMAGNSIPVKLLEGIFLQIKQLNEILEREDDVNGRT